ncbi:hypothetical protein AYI69_g4710 [Smittium culicis]|uniref:Uncharacterized protein n=1 Tax=Smittium culicis TaxID=133412 RepID=A0A1R1YC25_9FUNG|nr:hypothetical protein AYI69_g4710 [Smittium culicis]
MNYKIPHQPEWMGLVERADLAIRHSLSIICYGDFSKWGDGLEEVVKGMRTRKSSVTGYSLHYLMFGVGGHEIKELPTQKFMRLNERKIELDKVFFVRHTIKRSANSSNIVFGFKKGETAMILDYKLRKNQIINKLLPRYQGPFVVKKLLKHNIYEVKKEKGKIQRYNASRIVRYFLLHGVTHKAVEF